MRLHVANAAAGILSGIRINRITDREVKAILVDDYLRLRRIVKDADEERRELVEKFQADWADELDAVESFRREDRPVVGHDAYLEAERDANRAIAAIFDREVDAGIRPVPMDSVLSSFADEELTLEQIAVLRESGIAG